MTQSLIELAERIEAQPWNRPGTDKTWVLQAMSAVLRFQGEVRQARLVGTS
jgi:hypothetical protein